MCTLGTADSTSEARAKIREICVRQVYRDASQHQRSACENQCLSVSICGRLSFADYANHADSYITVARMYPSGRQQGRSDLRKSVSIRVHLWENIISIWIAHGFVLFPTDYHGFTQITHHSVRVYHLDAYTRHCRQRGRSDSQDSCD